jgi:cardiolipin synthase
MIYMHWVFILIYVVITLAAIIAVLMDNRSPVKTLAWILVLAFLPIIGFVFYIFFGQNTRRERMISKHGMDELTKRSMLEFLGQQNLKLPVEHQGLIKLFMNQNMAMPFKDNQMEIYASGYDFIPALLNAIHAAKDHIHIESYILEDDPVGRLITDALITKKREGVAVRLIYDDVGCWHVKDRFFERLREEEIEVRPFLPVRFPQFTSKVNYRNHRKVCVIDGTVGFIGGMNLAMRYVKGTRNGKRWRDTHLKITGGAVYGLQRSFLVDWYFVDRTLINSRKFYPPVDSVLRNDCLAQVVTSSPVSQWPDIMQGYVRILNEAKDYVYMQSPYFMPTEPVMFAMQTAALSGVEVCLMIPRTTDSLFLDWASRSFVDEAIAGGVKVYLYEAGFLHSKILVSDDMLCSCGSTNVDFRSFENNLEANVFIYDKSMALRMKAMFEDDMKDCFLLNDVDSLKRPFAKRLWESFVRLFSPLL